MEKNITLILGSGVAWGIAYAGVIKALDELNIHISAIGGTSMGAMIGGLYASYPDIEHLYSIIEKFDTIQMAKIFIPTLPHGGIVRNEGIRRFLKDVVGSLNIEELPLPFFCPATDIETGEEVILQDGSLVEAIVSSISIPILFQPNHYRERFLVDGGLVNPLPIIYAQKYPDIVLGITVVPEKIKKQTHSTGGITLFLEKLTPRERGDYLSRMLSDTRKWIEAPGLSEVMSAMILISNREVILRIDPNIMKQHTIQLDMSAYGLFDFLKAKEIAAEGYEQTMVQRDTIFRMIEE